MKEIGKYIKKLKKGLVNREDIPYEILESEDFKEAERKAGIRVSDRRGFDIIENCFFVEECIKEEDEFDFDDCIYFDSFAEYYAFLDGDIYNHACYYQYDFSDVMIEKYKINTKRLKTHLIDYKIDDYTIPDTIIDMEEYKLIEKQKRLFEKWIEKFLACNDASEYLEVLEKLNKSKCQIRDTDLIISRLLLYDENKAFKIIMQLLNMDCCRYSWVLYLCEYFSPEKVLNNYHPLFEGSRQTLYKRRKKIKDLVNAFSSNSYTIIHKKGFDKSNHYYYVLNRYYIGTYFDSVYRYFCSFDEFASYVNNDLSDCDLSSAALDIDRSEFKYNASTIFPLKIEELQCNISKGYDNGFYVFLDWKDKDNHIIKHQSWYFDYFFDFAYFLNNDLSDTDFIMCDGIVNLCDIRDFNLQRCKFKSDFCDKFGIEYPLETLPEDNKLSFDLSYKNEEETKPILIAKNELSLDYNELFDHLSIGYISDLHLAHRCINAKCKSAYDQVFVIKQIANKLSEDDADFYLIGGDVATSYNHYRLFFESWRNRNTVCILGNHELWNYAGKSINEIVDIYRDALNANCILLHNSLLYQTSDNKVSEIQEDILSQLSVDELRNRLSQARFIIYGGIGFSRYNEEFNALKGIYRFTISRQQEIEESIKFDNLYKKVCRALYDKNVIIFSHNPKEDWNNDAFVDNFIYVSGHNHRNYFFDDGITRIYADNQIGYKNESLSWKYFYISREFDYFADFEDGIYTISKEEYCDFYRGKNIPINYNRDGTIYMLKRKGYYCFIRTGKSCLSILNGGALKKLAKDVTYYYDNMLSEISIISEPYYKYLELQKRIANQIISIGGNGYIHGCIIDIDFYNHIYLNPFDLTITGYYATDMVYKYVYKNIPSLLCDKCPLLYNNYKKYLRGKKEDALIVVGNTEIVSEPTLYTHTDIYRASREIKKIEKVNKGILVTWHERANDGKKVEQK